jgi:hypothetical protein
MNSLFGSRISFFERTNDIECCVSDAPHFAALRLCVNFLFRKFCLPNGHGII